MTDVRRGGPRDDTGVSTRAGALWSRSTSGCPGTSSGDGGTVCYRIGLRLDDPGIPALLVAHGQPGFYLRVIEAGELGPVRRQPDAELQGSRFHPHPRHGCDMFDPEPDAHLPWLACTPNAPRCGASCLPNDLVAYDEHLRSFGRSCAAVPHQPCRSRSEIRSREA